VAAIPQIISGIIDAVIGSVPQLVAAGVQLFIALIENLPTIITEIIKAIPQIISGIVDAFGGYFGKMSEVGGNLLKGLWQGISDAGAWLWDKISGFFGGIVDGIKDFFGIHSPSKLFANLGGFMAEGLGEGFGDEMKSISQDMQNAIPTEFDTNLQTSINSIGVPTASGFSGDSIDVTIPLSIDGNTLTKIVSRIQWNQNAVTVRNMGVVS
jgi:phage-related protein